MWFPAIEDHNYICKSMSGWHFDPWLIKKKKKNDYWRINILANWKKKKSKILRYFNAVAAVNYELTEYPIAVNGGDIYGEIPIIFFFFVNNNYTFPHGRVAVGWKKKTNFVPPCATAPTVYTRYGRVIPLLPG